MTILKSAAAACVLLVAAACASGLLPAPPSEPSTVVPTASGYPPAVDMRQFQHAFG